MITATDMTRALRSLVELNARAVTRGLLLVWADDPDEVIRSLAHAELDRRARDEAPFEPDVTVVGLADWDD